MIKEIQFKNFKVLRDTTLPLGQFTLIVGPNGSGKSTALEAFNVVPNPGNHPIDAIVSAGRDCNVSIRVVWHPAKPALNTIATWHANRSQSVSLKHFDSNGGTLSTGGGTITEPLREHLRQCRVYDLDPDQLSRAVPLQPALELESNGFGLAAILDSLRDRSPERFEALNREFNQWLPEFDRVLFEVPNKGERSLLLRTVEGHAIPAAAISHGTLLALAILTLAYLPDPPPLVAFEDPDRGLHPRLLRDVQDALYRLAYPENFGEQRDPVQVIATTHSPYFLDLFKDHPEEIVIAEKRGNEAVFHRLADRPDIEDILQDASLGEVWYSGILGGVPAEP